MMNRFVIDFTIYRRMSQQRGKFRSKNQFFICVRVEKRFLAHAVAGQEKRFVALVPDCEREHSAQVLWAFRAVLVVSVNYRFGVAVSVKSVTERFQLFAELTIVVNLAVEYDRGRAVGIVD